ncbi:hypothetical protein [Rhodococcus koreensis]
MSLHGRELEDPELVTLHWNDGGPDGQALDLIDRAARADAEMSFGPDLRHPSYERAFLTAQVYTRLRRWNAPRAKGPALAAVITLTSPSERGPIVIDAVVDPDFRSTGVITAAFETLGQSPPEQLGAGGRSVAACAYGSHPAALRTANRFGAQVSAVRDVLVLPSKDDNLRSRLPSGSVHFRAVPTGNAVGGEWQQVAWRLVDGDTPRALYAATHRETGDVAGFFALEDRGGATRLVVLGPSVPAAEDETALRGIVGAALPLLWDREDGIVEAVVEQTDVLLLETLRSAAFQHDRTDVVFESDLVRKKIPSS